MPAINGSLQKETFSCTKCGGFLWIAGICDPCAGQPFEQDTPSVVENVIYKSVGDKVVTRPRKR